MSFSLPDMHQSVYDPAGKMAQVLVTDDDATLNSLEVANGTALNSLGVGDATNNVSIDNTGDVTLNGTAKVWKNKTFTFNYARVLGVAKPTLVNRGVFFGFSMPIFNSDDEELYTCNCVDEDWDGVTDFRFHISGWLDTANNAKNFNFQLSVETYDPVTNEVVPTSSTNYEVETATGNANQYTSFEVNFTIDVSTLGVIARRPVGLRLRRIAASGSEITGEFVVEGASLSYLANKLGGDA